MSSHDQDRQGEIHPNDRKPAGPERGVMLAVIAAAVALAAGLVIVAGMAG